MQLARLDNGEFRLTLVDYAGDTLRIESRGEVHRKLVLTFVDDEGADVCVELTRHQVRELLPHLAAFGETGSLEVGSDAKS